MRAGGQSAREPAPLTAVRLRNVGPFAELHLTFTAGWNALVADNGCGKSTVLRAIAMALCGNDDRAVRTAARLLKSGQTSGSIELRFGADKFVTGLIREGTRVRVESELVTPVQTGEWLVLGFPPLRGISTRRPQTPTGQRPLGPGVEDLLPLVTGDIDERLDDLKQWIINRTFAEVARRRSTAVTTNIGEKVLPDRDRAHARGRLLGGVQPDRRGNARSDGPHTGSNCRCNCCHRASAR